MVSMGKRPVSSDGWTVSAGKRAVSSKERAVSGGERPVRTRERTGSGRKPGGGARDGAAFGANQKIRG